MPKKHAQKSAKKGGATEEIDKVARMGISEGVVEKKAAGRPSGYSDEIADRICGRISTSRDSLRTICKEDSMPDVSTVFRWMRQNEGFRELYARSKQEQAEMLVEEMIEIADDGLNDVIVKADGTEITNSEVIQRSKLRVDTRKWLASKLLPKKYGDKLDMDIAHSGQIDSKVTLTEERRKTLAEKKRNSVLRRVASVKPGAN